MAVIGAFGFIAWQQRWFGLGGATGEFEEAQSSQPRDAPEDSPSDVVAMGRLEPTLGIIDVVGVLGDRVEKLTVREGDAVKEGEEIGHFESRSMRQLEVDLARTQLEESESRLNAEMEGAQKKLASARIAEEGEEELAELDAVAQAKQVEILKLHRDQAKADLARLERLANTPTSLVSKQEVEHQSLALNKATEEVASAEAALQRLNKATELKQKTTAADRAAAEAGVEQARRAFPVESLRRQLVLAEERLRQATIPAPITGTVLKVFTPQGSSVGQRPVLQVADLSRMVCIAEVYDNEIHRIREKQEVAIESKTFQDSASESGKPPVLRGQVSRIGRVVGTPELKAIDPYAPVDRRVIEVRIEIRPEDVPRAARFINLQVDVRFSAVAPQP